MQVATISDFSTTFFSANGGTATSLAIGPLTLGTTWFWRVNATNVNSTGAWSGASSFMTVEDYTTWPNRQVIAFNTTALGAPIQNNVTRFPVLVRITGTTVPGFGQYGGNDLRHSKTSDFTKAFPYQIDYLSATNDTAAIWVLVDTVYANSASQTITMFYGNAIAPAKSNGAAVFDTANGFAGVWHLNSGYADATVNARNGTAVGTITDTMGIIGHAQKMTINGASRNAIQVSAG